MILQELCKYYDILDNSGKVAKSGYSVEKIHYAIILNNDGTIEKFMDLQNNNKPELMTVPEQPTRCGKNPSPYFLCDKYDYVLGDKFDVFKEYNLRILESVNNIQANAFKAFLNNKPENPSLPDDKKFTDKNFVFMFGTDYIHRNDDIKAAWQNSRAASDVTAQCLLSGKNESIARLHPKIKGVKDAQMSGANIVSFNERAFESYGKDQSFNAPVGEMSAFKYGTVLNYMLQSGSPQKMTLGDSTVVFWAQHESPKYNEIFNAFLSPSAKAEDNKSDDEKSRDIAQETLVKDVLTAIKEGKSIAVGEEDIKKDTTFCILALAPNNARISIRFFHKDTFGGLLSKIGQHYEDMKIVDARLKTVPIWLLVKETVHEKGDPSPLLAGKILSAILTGGLYPSDLFAKIIKRVYAQQDVNYIKAGIIKAYLLRKYRVTNNELKEDITVNLNEELKEPAYLLGRLFAVLEQAQWKAVGDVNSGIKERFFASAASSPKRIFPQLLKNTQNHLAKMVNSVWIDKKIGEILAGIEDFPVQFNLDEQGLFMLGYYHQRQALFTKKEEKGE